MVLEHAQAIANAAEENGLDVTLYKDYSGRGMYGRTTAGVVGSRQHILACAAQAAVNLAREAEAGDDDYGEVESFIDSLAATASDSMGHDIIVY